MKVKSILSFCHMILIVVLAFISTPLMGAWISKMPVKITQPDGKVIECFSTGDEYHNWVHDADNYTIIQSPKTGYYTYAEKDGENVKASELIVGRDDAQRFSLRPGVNISDRLYKERRARRQEAPTRNTLTSGTITNLVVFIRFADQTEFGENVSVYDGWLNSNTNSLHNYFLEASYNALTVYTYMYPAANNGMVVSYQSGHNRGYYCPYNSTTNPGGYHDDDELSSREWGLIENAIAAVGPSIPTIYDYDINNNGSIDNIVFIVRGATTDWGSILWPHKWSVQDREIFLNGKQVNGYNLQVQDNLAGSSVGVLCHEFFHTLGAPDLYHYAEDWIYSPAGSWDIMDTNPNPPEHMSAFMKWKYGDWIDDIPIITLDQAYTLNPLTTATGNAYRINSPFSSDEYFVVEYRKKSGTFESSLPGSGLLVWRIKTNCGNGNADGPPDEVYLYRPDGTTTVNGSIDLANFSSNSGRMAIDQTTNPTPFLSDGSAGGLSLYNIGGTDATMSFTKGSPAGITIDFSTNPYTEGFENSSCPPVNWLKYKESGNFSFEHVTSSPNPTASPYAGNWMLRYPSNLAASGDAAVISTPRFAVTDITNYDYNVSFRMYRDNGQTTKADRIEVYANITSGMVGNPILLGTIHRSTTLSPSALSTGWYEYSFNVSPPAIGFYHIVFKAISAAGNNIYLDSFSLQKVTFPATTSKWTGIVSTDWFNVSNWRNGWVPDASKDVIIPAGTHFNPSLLTSNASCRDLILDNGATLTIDNNTLYTYRYCTINGTLVLANSTPKLICYGDLSFNSTATLAGTSAAQEVQVHGNCVINNLSQFQMQNGTLILKGSSGTSFVINSPTVRLKNLDIQKAGSTAYISNLSSGNLRIDGNFTVTSGSLTAISGYCDIDCYGNVTATGDLNLYVGTLKMCGTTSQVNLSTGSFVNNFMIINSNIVTLLSNLTASGAIDFYNGTLIATDRTIRVGGNWRQQYVNRFTYTGSTVIFDGWAGDQSITTANFNILRLNNTTNKLLIASGVAVRANVFDYVSGTVEVTNGTFTVYDMEAVNIDGKYILNGGHIYLTQDSEHYVDLDADITITGGEFLINGGTNFPSDWAYTHEITVNISGGTLDFASNGIGMTDNGHTLNMIFTGGTIRTCGSLSINRPNIFAFGGTYEMYGENDATVAIHSASAFDILNINKDTGRSRNNPTRYFAVTLASNISLDTDLIVTSGTLNLGTYTCTVAGLVKVYGTLGITQSAAVLNANSDIFWYTGSTGNITAGTINVKGNWTNQSGITLLMTTGNTVNFIGTSTTFLSLADENASFGNIVINKTTNSVLVNSDTQYLKVAGNLTVNTGNSFNFRNSTAVISGTLTISGSTSFGAGCTANSYNLNLVDTMTMTDATVSVSHSFTQQTTGALTITSGCFVIDSPYTGGYFNFAGITNLNGGAFQITNDGIQFGAGTQFHHNGGTLRFGGGFKAIAANVFQPSQGTVEFIGARTSTLECNNGNYFNDVIFNKPGISYQVLIMTDITVNNDMFVQGGNPILMGHTLNVSRDMSISGGRLTANNVADVINIGRNWSNTFGTNGFIETNNTVNFISAQIATISTESFNIVNINKTASSGNVITVSAGSTLTASGLLTITSGCLQLGENSILDANSNIIIQSGAALSLYSATGSNTMRMAGNLTDNNTVANTVTGFYTGNTSTLQIDGSADQTLYGNYSRMYFGHVYVNKSGGKVLHSNQLIFNGNFTLFNGEWSYAVSGKSKTFNGDVIVEAGGNFSDSTATTTFAGTSNVSLKILGTARFGNISVNKGTVTPTITMTGNVTIARSITFTLTSGTVNLNGYTFNFKGTMSVGSAGKVNLTPASVLNLGSASSLSINSGGQFASIGTGFSLAHVTSSTGYYGFNVNSGAIIAADYTVFEKMNANGINLISGSLVDTTHCFNGCYFQSGATNGTLLQLNGQQNLTIWGATFPANTWSGIYNVSRTQTIGTITFRNYGGAFSGGTFDYNPNGNIIWGALTPPAAPANLRISYSNNAAVLTWDPVPGVTGYRIYRALSYEDIDSAEEVGTTDMTTTSDESIIVYPKAFYFIKAYVE